MTSVHSLGGQSVEATFSGPVNAADWLGTELEIETDATWQAATSVSQGAADSLIWFGDPWHADPVGDSWRLLTAPIGVDLPESGNVT